MNHKHPLILAAMLSLSMHSAWALEPVNTTLIKSEGLELKIKPEQLTRIKTIGADLDVQIKNAFKGEEALQNEMQAELEKIVKITDESAKLAAITAYQNKYKSRYQAVLAKGKVNLADVTARLNSAVPEMDFTLNPNLTIKGNFKKVTSEKFSAPPPTTTATIASNNSPNTTVKNLVHEDYTITRDLGCGQNAGSVISVSGGYMTNKSTAIAAGICANEGAYNHTFTIPTGKKVKVEATYDLTGYPVAVGIGGISLSMSQASLSVFSGQEEVYLDEDVTINTCVAVAAIAWVSSTKCEIIGGRFNVTLTNPRTFKIIANTLTKQAALVGGAFSESRIKKLRVTLTTSNR